MQEFPALLRATLKIYRSALSEAFGGLGKNWRLLLVHIAVLPVCAVAPMIAMQFGGLIGGFMLGLFLAFVLSGYLVTVGAAVGNERLHLSELRYQAAALWGPVIGVLFAIFLIDWVSTALLRQESQLWLIAVVNLLVAVLFNVLPELLYQRTNASLQLLADSFEFMRENFVEWAIPHALFAGLIYLVSPVLAVRVGFMLILSNPLRLIENFFLALSSPAMLLQQLLLVVCMLVGTYYFFIFRGILFRELSTSTRRKRIYRERFS